MTATQTPAASECRGSASLAAGHQPEPYDPAVDVDMIGTSVMEYDGPRCAADDCDTAVDDDGDRCDDCAAEEPDPEPHYYACPTCGGNGCTPCRGTGERLDTPKGIR